ncbi:DUF3040 domain-containing protein [Corynebacterium sp. 335C]
MALSEQEQRMLDEIESALYAEDPKFGSAMSARAFGDGGGSPRGFSIRTTALLVLGLVLLIGGMVLSLQSLWFIALSVVGFLVMFGAGVWAMTGSGDGAARRPGRAVRRPGSARAGRTGRSGRGGNGGGGMEERFRNRFGQM